MDNTTASFQQLLGQTEKTLNAILDRRLADAVSEPQWIALVLTGNVGPSDTLDEVTARLAGALKTDTQAASDQIAQLAARGLLSPAPGDRPGLTLTEAGQQFVSQVQGWAGELTQRLWGNLPDSDMEIARRVLGIVLERGEAELATGSC